MSSAADEMKRYADLLADDSTVLVSYDLWPDGGMYVELVERVDDHEIVLRKGRA